MFAVPVPGQFLVQKEADNGLRRPYDACIYIYICVCICKYIYIRDEMYWGHITASEKYVPEYHGDTSGDICIEGHIRTYRGIWGSRCLAPGRSPPNAATSKVYVIQVGARFPPSTIALAHFSIYCRYYCLSHPFRTFSAATEHIRLVSRIQDVGAGFYTGQEQDLPQSIGICGLGLSFSRCKRVTDTHIKPTRPLNRYSQPSAYTCPNVFLKRSIFSW